jgi:hypothetical protein
VDVPVRCLSRCRYRQAVLAQRSPFPIRNLSKEGWGTRWTGAWPTDDNRSKSRPLFKAARAFRTKPFAAKLRVAKGAVGDEKTDNRQAGCATPRSLDAGSGCLKRVNRDSRRSSRRASPRGTGRAIAARKDGA